MQTRDTYFAYITCATQDTIRKNCVCSSKTSLKDLKSDDSYKDDGPRGCSRAAASARHSRTLAHAYRRFATTRATILVTCWTTGPKQLNREPFCATFRKRVMDSLGGWPRSWEHQVFGSLPPPAGHSVTAIFDSSETLRIVYFHNLRDAGAYWDHKDFAEDSPGAASFQNSDSKA